MSGARLQPPHVRRRHHCDLQRREGEQGDQARDARHQHQRRGPGRSRVCGRDVVAQGSKRQAVQRTGSGAAGSSAAHMAHADDDMGGTHERAPGVASTAGDDAALQQAEDSDAESAATEPDRERSRKIDKYVRKEAWLDESRWRREVNDDGTVNVSFKQNSGEWDHMYVMKQSLIGAVAGTGLLRYKAGS